MGEPSPSVSGPPVVEPCAALATDNASMPRVTKCCTIERGIVDNDTIKNDAKKACSVENDVKLSCEIEVCDASSGNCLESDGAVSANDSLDADLEQNGNGEAESCAASSELGPACYV